MSEHWMKRLQKWASLTLEGENLTSVIDAGYQQFTLANVARMRMYMLTDDEFVELCKSTSSALQYRGQIAMLSLQNQRAEDITLAAIASVFPDYSSFYKVEDVTSGRIALHSLAKLQIFESELYALVQSLITKDVTWMNGQIAEMKSAALQFWEGVTQKGL